MALTLLPAVDVCGGHAVRPVTAAAVAAGSPGTHGDPLELALAWQRAGAEWIHLVDLDAAFRRGSNSDLLARVIARVGVKVQLSGGISDDASLATAVAMGADRLIVGTAALADPVFCRRAAAELGELVAFGLDVQGTTLRARGGGGEYGELGQALGWLDCGGAARYVVTDVARDGRMLGPNLDLLRRVCAATTAPVIASGGVSNLADLRALQEVDGVEGVIVGQALHEGTFTLEQALEVLHR
jgi:phosphoribosyl isomerase A